MIKKRKIIRLLLTRIIPRTRIPKLIEVLMKISSWIYYSIAGIVVILGVSVAIFFGAKPRSLPKISFSHFESPEEFGGNIYKRLRLEINSHHVLFLGVQPQEMDHLLIWKGFLDSLENSNKFELVIADKSLGEIKEFQINETISLQENPEEIAEYLKKIISGSKKIIILAPTSYLSYMIQNNFQSFLREAIYGSSEKIFDVGWLTFSLSKFANQREDEKSIPFPCNTSPHDLDGSSELGCLILTKSKVNYRKKRISNKYPGMLEQIGSKEYLALFAEKNK